MIEPCDDRSFPWFPHTTAGYRKGKEQCGVSSQASARHWSLAWVSRKGSWAGWVGWYVKCDTAEYAKRSPSDASLSPMPLPHNMRRNQIDAKCKWRFDAVFYFRCFCFLFSWRGQQLPKLNERNLDKRSTTQQCGPRERRGGCTTPVNDINVEQYSAHKNLHMDEVRAQLAALWLRIRIHIHV